MLEYSILSQYLQSSVDLVPSRAPSLCNRVIAFRDETHQTKYDGCVKRKNASFLFSIWHFP